MLLPQPDRLSCGIALASVGDGDVVEHGGHLPGESVEVEATLPEPGPAGGCIPDTFCPPPRILVPAAM
ncbi:MAG: hypothetical protein WCE80_09995 [Acidimicrobiia bacterium]